MYSQLHSLSEDLFNKHIESIDQQSEFILSSFSSNLILLFISFLIFILISIIITVIGTFIKYFRLKIQQTTNRIEIEMGLKTNTKVSFQARRLQRLKISTNPIQKKLNIHEASFSLASSNNDLSKSKIAIPGLNPKIIENIKSFLYGDQSFHPKNSYRPHIAWFNRRIILSCLPLLLIWLVSVPQNITDYWPLLLSFSIVYLLTLILYQKALFKRFHLNINDNFLVINSGLWDIKSEFVELYKMEGISIRQPFWYKRRKLYNIVFHTAGGDIFVRAIPSQFLKEVNYLLYKIESSQKPWM